MVHNKNISVDTVETKMASTGNTKYILTMGKDKHYFWRLENGSEGEVFKSFMGMSNAGLIKKGSVAAIGFTEEDESFVNKEGKTINYRSRHIVGLREAGIGAVVSAPSTAEKPRGEANSASSEKLGRNWDREAYEKCCSLWSAALFQGSGIDAPIKRYIGDGHFWNLFQAIKADGAKRFSPVANAPPLRTYRLSIKTTLQMES